MDPPPAIREVGRWRESYFKLEPNQGIRWGYERKAEDYTARTTNQLMAPGTTRVNGPGNQYILERLPNGYARLLLLDTFNGSFTIQTPHGTHRLLSSGLVKEDAQNAPEQTEKPMDMAALRQKFRQLYQRTHVERQEQQQVLQNMLQKIQTSTGAERKQMLPTWIRQVGEIQASQAKLLRELESINQVLQKKDDELQRDTEYVQQLLQQLQAAS